MRCKSNSYKNLSLTPQRTLQASLAGLEHAMAACTLTRPSPYGLQLVPIARGEDQRQYGTDTRPGLDI